MPAGVDVAGVGRVPKDPRTEASLQHGLPEGEADAELAEVADQPMQGAAALGVPGEHLGDDGRLGRVEVDARRVAGPVGRHPVAVRGAGPGEHLASPVAALAAAPRPLGDQGPLVLGDGAADLEQELVVRVPGHRAVEELDAAALGLQLLEQEGLVDEVAGQPVGVGQEDRVEGGRGRRVAEAVEAGPLERGAAVAVVTEDVRLGELPAPGLGHGPAAARSAPRWSGPRPAVASRHARRSQLSSVASSAKVEGPARRGPPRRRPSRGPPQEQLVGAVPPALPVRVGHEPAGRPPTVVHGRLPEAMCLGEDKGHARTRPGSAGAAGLEAQPAVAGQAELVVCD